MRGFLVLIALLLLASCSSPSFVAQRYQNFTAYYNTFYNAQEAFEQGTASLTSTQASIDRDRYLPVFVPPDQASGSKDFDLTIQKAADVLRNHPESKWVDDALLLIGKSYFYQQNYVGAAQKFREAIALETGLEGEARFWLARSLIQSGANEAAETHLRASLDERDTSFDTWTAMMRLARGELYARQGRWEDAAIALDRGLSGDPNDRAAARAAFLLGQVRETLGIYTAAARAYEVVNENYQPRYELSFAARISAIRVRGMHGEAEAALDRLRRMERDDKNVEKRGEMTLLRGQLYQAMGQSQQARRTYRELLYDSDSGAGRAVRGPVHHALGVLYQVAYDDFSRAAAHFDTAATALGRVPLPTDEALGTAPAAIRDSRSRADLFRNLADKAGLVTRLDSLLRLGDLSDEAFQEVVATLRTRRAEEESRRRRVAERREAAQRFGETIRTERAGGSQQQQQQAAAAAGSDVGFLSYRNPVQAQEARRNFERRWGSRPLVPNWRRLDAIRSQGGAEQDTAPADDPVAAASDPAVGPGASPAAAVDISAVPRDSTSQAQMRAQRAVARYEFGNALFLAAGRPDSAAAWYRRVIDEDAEQPVAQRALYALAEAYQSQGDTAAARAAYQQVIDRYPRSAFAQRARQQMGQSPEAETAPPDSLVQAEAEYAQAYTTWEAGGHDQALQQFVDVATQYGRTPIAAKALWAATTVSLQQRAGRPRTADMPLPSVFGRVLGASDSTASLPANRSVEDSVQAATGSTLRDVLQHIATQYPETPQARRAEQLQQALDARAPDPPATADSVRTDSIAGDSSQVTGPMRIDSAATDSAATDSAATDTMMADAARGDASSSAWVIIVALHANEAEAIRMRQEHADRISQEEVAMRVRPVTVADTTRFQVTVGPFSSEAEATAARDRLGPWLPATARVAAGSSP